MPWKTPTNDVRHPQPFGIDPEPRPAEPDQHRRHQTDRGIVQYDMGPDSWVLRVEWAKWDHGQEVASWGEYGVEAERRKRSNGGCADIMTAQQIQIRMLTDDIDSTSCAWLTASGYYYHPNGFKVSFTDRKRSDSCAILVVDGWLGGWRWVR